MHDHGIDVDVIMGTRTKDLLILENEMREVSGNLYITTDDGSYGRKGVVTAVIEELVKTEAYIMTSVCGHRANDYDEICSM